MANAITKFKTYIALLDEVYKQASLTADLDSDPTLVKAGANANEIIIPKISMDGLADYSRNSGYVKGDVTLTNETVTFNYDRGRKFSVDNMDNEETAGLAFGRLSSEFIRVKVAPEQDAFRFATYAGTTGISKVSAGATLSSGNDVLTALITAQNKMDEDEVSPENRILYITPTLYNLAINVDTTKSKAVLDGFAKATTAKDINFMIIQKSAVIQYPKHTVNKVVTPEENQTDDSWLFFFRAYGLADVYENKAAGIYLHHKA